MDFSKAFDKVCHRKLILKLEHYGVRNDLLRWITDFLTDRTQCVVVRGTSSPLSSVKSGVPQGSVLGPLLFLIYINDMPLTVESLLALFADDSFLYRAIISESDAVILQNDLSKLESWEDEWSMEFHPKKCKVLRITNKRKPIITSYSIHNEKLETVEKAKYLGVTITKNLSWKDHINSIAAKATNTRLFLQRNLAHCFKEVKAQCYKTFIRPILEYASTVWSPHNTTSLIHKLEMVQRKACRWIESKWEYHHSPTVMLKSLKLDPLESRRDLSCLKMLFDIINGFKYMKDTQIPVRQRTANTRYKLVHARLKVYEISFFPYTIQLWNSLPNNVINTLDRESFQKLLNIFLNRSSSTSYPEIIYF